MTEGRVETSNSGETRSPMALHGVDWLLKRDINQLAELSAHLSQGSTTEETEISLAETNRIFTNSRRWFFYYSVIVPLFFFAVANGFSAPKGSFDLRFFLYNSCSAGIVLWIEASGKPRRNQLELKRYQLWKVAGEASIPYIIESLPKTLKKEHLESAPIRIKLLANLLMSDESNTPLTDQQKAKLIRYCESPDPTQHDQELIKEPIRQLKAALDILENRSKRQIRMEKE